MNRTCVLQEKGNVLVDKVKDAAAGAGTAAQQVNRTYLYYVYRNIRIFIYVYVRRSNILLNTVFVFTIIDWTKDIGGSSWSC